MPSTVNGVGTTYFLKRNRQYQDGVCEHCHERVRLESYETWYCICVLFIPVLPLGKKQILNYCPRCTRHRIVNFGEWEKIRTEAIAETSEELAESKDDFNAAIKMHATLVAVQKSDDADRLSKIMLERFGHEPQVQFYLGGCYERAGKNELANACFLKAHELDPQDIGLIRAAALVHIEQNRPDEGKVLLQAFGPNSEHYEPALFYILGCGYQKLGRHQDALAVFRELYDSNSGLANNPSFRKSVKLSEKALAIDKPLLPYDPWYRSSFVKWSAITIGVLCILGGWNFYVATHRKLYVVNGRKTPIKVRVDGNQIVQVAGVSKNSIEVGEGAHHLEVIDPPNSFTPIQFNLSVNWWERYLRSPVFVADPTRTAGVVFEQTVYQAQGAGQNADQKYELHVAEPFMTFHHANYHFEEFPAQIKVKGGGRVIKTRVDMIHEPPSHLLNGAANLGKSPAEQLEFMEAHLEADPADDTLLQMYSAMGLTTHPDRVRAFLEKHLVDRPVRILWHRRYQDLARFPVPGDNTALPAQSLLDRYDAWLKVEPRNSALLYLRGRLERRATTTLPFLQAALDADPQNAYALFSRGFSALSVGDARTAVEHYQQAVGAKPGDLEFAAGLYEARFAAREFPALEQELRQKLTTNPQDLRSIQLLLKLLIAAGRGMDAETEYQAALVRLGQFRTIPEMAALLTRSIEIPYLYAKGDFIQLGQKMSQLNDPAQVAETSFALGLETGKLPEVPDSVFAFQKSYWHLLRSLAAKKQGQAEQAALSRKMALEHFKKCGLEQTIVAEILAKPTEVTFEEVQDLLITTTEKAIFLIALAEDAPLIREPCLDLAEKLNVELEFPHHLLKGLIADQRARK